MSRLIKVQVAEVERRQVYFPRCTAETPAPRNILNGGLWDHMDLEKYDRSHDRCRNCGRFILRGA